MATKTEPVLVDQAPTKCWSIDWKRLKATNLNNLSEVVELNVIMSEEAIELALNPAQALTDNGTTLGVTVKPVTE